MVSPLTPALSPLSKGRGSSRWTLMDHGSCVAAFVAPRVLDTRDENVMNAAMDDALTEDVVRAPSPLNGERAGVRGECGSGASFVRM